MTIASEIQRLQTAKANIKTAIQNKGVSVPSSAKLSDMNTYINNIYTGVPWEDLLLPASIQCQDVIRNTEHGVWFHGTIWDTLSPDWNTYYHYHWYESSEDSSDEYHVWLMTKQKWQNPVFSTLFSVDEWNYYYHSLNYDADVRMKKEGSNLVLSLLYYDDYDSNGWASSWWTLTRTYYYVNITNGAVTSTWNLWTITAVNRGFIDTDIAAKYAARETACWLTSANKISNLGLTSLSYDRWSQSYLYTLTATINYS